MPKVESAWKKSMSQILSIFLLFSIGYLQSCKKKNSQDGGLLEEPAKPKGAISPASLNALGPSAGGDWKITCVPTENPNDPRVYIIDLSGAVSEIDENQTVKISIHKTTKVPVAPSETSKEIAKDELGRGLIAKQGAIFFGFAGGALTGQYQANTKKHDGLLTLVQDQDVAGLGVSCEAVATTPGITGATPPQAAPIQVESPPPAPKTTP